MQALISNSQRLQILQQLFADIALKVDDRARGTISYVVSTANFLLVVPIVKGVDIDMFLGITAMSLFPM
jgi:hypothetical protein